MFHCCRSLNDFWIRSLLTSETDPAILEQVASKYGPEYFALFLRDIDLDNPGPETEVGVLHLAATLPMMCAGAK